MSDPPIEDAHGFEIRVDETRGETSVIIVSGELDLATSPKLTAAIAGLPEAPHPVVLDVANLSFVDSSGVRALIESEQALASQGRRLALLNPSPPLVRLLELVDLRSRFVEIEGLDADDLAGLSGAS